MQNFETLSTQIISKLETSGEKKALSTFKKAIQNPTYKNLAININKWEKQFLAPNPKLKTRVNHELMLLTHYFKEKEVLDFYNGNIKTKKTYYWEILCIVIGFVFTAFGIEEEIHHQYSVSYNSKGMMVFHNGGMTCFYGVALLVSCFASIYGKKKTNIKKNKKLLFISLSLLTLNFQIVNIPFQF
jgi:hypothetical protein